MCFQFFLLIITIYLDYWKQDPIQKQSGEDDSQVNNDENQATPTKFTIRNPGGCTNATEYGFRDGRPCVLVKMNKVRTNQFEKIILHLSQVVGFIPEPGCKVSEKEAYAKVCPDRKDAIGVHCHGEVIINKNQIN